jgi:short-chain fatty acids transporter
LKKLTNFFVAIVNRWLPDAFLFAVILTIVTYILALIFTDNGPIAMVNYWGNSKGFWGLLSFSMQMALVVVLGTAFANAPVCKRILKKIATLAHDNKSAILTITFISTICCWLNWGFGLVAGALLAKEIARRVPTVDYRLLIASAYSGFVIWHAGLSGSIPLTITSETTIADITFTVPLSQTIFHPINLLMVLVILVIMPFLNYSMHPDKEHCICVDPTMLKEDVERTYTVKTPADRLEHSKIMWIITLVLGFGYLVYYFATSGFNLTINVVNMIFMFLGILAHGRPSPLCRRHRRRGFHRGRHPAPVPVLCGHHGHDGRPGRQRRLPRGSHSQRLRTYLQQRHVPDADLPVRRYHQLLRTVRRRPVGSPGSYRHSCC